ncbi:MULTISPECIES: hypothetical protein [unclassified Nocardioides]|uniref:hypothetical protein n=1 Tax=unclassified Nocardioides TaxID=2615069 RepID=UPI0009F1492A|nr:MULTISPECIES: hypothetical protein [unclassified Nocardioides]GAW47859.1 uncharacterized protein (Precursor) [Nocardioides sp. PD653-B2]GAW53840.1 uncharacterized protein (Precursor) [Nocardioides sp. PD653]
MTRRVRTWLLLVLLVVVVNLPLVHSTWTSSRVDGAGIDVTAQVTRHEVRDGGHWVEFTLPERVDPDRRTWSAELDEPAYDEAVAAGEVGVRVLEDEPSAYRVDGAVAGHGVLVVTLSVDALLLVALLLLWRFRGRVGPLRTELRAVALGDVVRCPPGAVFDRIAGEDYLIQGEVVELEPGTMVLDVGDRRVVVLLDGHANPVGYQQPARVRARVIGSSGRG